MNTVFHILFETVKPHLRRVSSKLPEMAHRVLSLLVLLTLLFNPLLTAAAAASTADPSPAALPPDVESPGDLSAPAEPLPQFYRPLSLSISEFGAPTLAEQPASRLPHAESDDASTLAEQPDSLQSAYSEAMGNDDATYHVVTDGQGGWQAATPSQNLSSAFTAAGVVVRAGDDSLQLTLRQVGYGEQLTAVQTAAPQVDGNRVLYRRGDLIEWYVNGPLGLEQGFTLDAPPPPPLNPPHGGGGQRPGGETPR